MTRAEAIEWIYTIDTNYDLALREREALRMAIEALQAEGGDAEMNEVKSPYMQQSPNGATHGRLIDAEALMKELSDIQPYNWTESEAEIQEEADYSLFKSLINSAPTVQADRPHGEWIETSEGTMCGNCHKFPYDDGEYHIANWHSDFCPNCGCVMDNGGGANE